MKKVRFLLPWFVLVLFAWAYHVQIPLVKELRQSTFDAYQTVFPRENVDLPVYVIDVDEKSLEEMGQWPWPRNVLAELVESSFDLGLKSLGFDMVFPERDGKSPEEVLRYWQADESLKENLSKLPSHDAQFAASIANYPVVQGIVSTFQGLDEPVSGMGSKTPLNASEGALGSLVEGRVMVRNIPEIENASISYGNFSYYFENDSVVRKVPLLFKEGESVFPALSAEALRLYGGDKPYELSEGVLGSALTIAPFPSVPLGVDGQYRVYYRHYDKSRYISAVDVLKKRESAKKLDGALALVGTSAAGLFDLRSTPLDAVVPGVESHMQIVENIWLGAHITRPENAQEIEFWVQLAFSVLLIMMVAKAGAFTAFCSYLFLMGGVIVWGFWQFQTSGLLYDWAFPSLTLTVMFLVQSLVKYADEKDSRLAIRSAFAHYLSPDLVKIIAKDVSKLSLGGEQKEVSVLFSDIRGFTSISEKLTPQQLTGLLNRYLTPMTEIVQNHKGTIDKYMGDAVMAFWNAPLDVKDHPKAACAAALDMLSSLQDLNKELVADGLPALDIGIGVNTDVVNVGNMGSEQRFDYTVMGDGVNLGSRLEGQCKTYGVKLIISKSTLSKLGDVTAMPLDKVAVKGKKDGVEIFELISLSEPEGENAQKIDCVKRALNAYYDQQWENARQEFESDLIPLTLRQMYLERISMFEKEGCPENWDGVYHATSK